MKQILREKSIQTTDKLNSSFIDRNDLKEKLKLQKEQKQFLQNESKFKKKRPQKKKSIQIHQQNK